jgi:NADP-dependent 3-hydroxy acid dehydrogenase YdfG
MTRTASITGASGGIGREIAARLARDGWRILAQGRRPEALDETLARVRAAGGEAAAFPAELGDMDEVARLADWANGHGPLDAVIQAAGGGGATPIAPESFAAWDGILDLILRAPMRLAALTLPRVAEAEGCFVFIAGMYAKQGVATRSGYSAARHGIKGFAEALFEDVREQGVGVSLVHPGFVNTPLVSLERIDPARMIQAEDIAEAVAIAVTLPKTSCIVEMTVRPQRSPYRR